MEAKMAKKRIEFYLILTILISALAIRIDYNINHEAPLLGDTYYMVKYAKTIAETGQYPLHNGIYWSPGLVYFLGWLIPWIGEDKNYFNYRIIQSLLSVVSLVGYYLLAKKIFGNPSALLAFLLLAFYPPLIFYTGMIYVENLFFVLLPFLFLFLIKWRDEGGFINPLVCGILFGLLHLIRPVLIPMPILFVAWFLLTVPRKVYKVFFIWELPICALTALLVLMPWIVHNYNIYGSIITSSAVGGLNFYIGHNEKANGTWVQIDENSKVFQLAGTPEGNRLGYQEGLAFIKSHLKQEVQLTIEKMRMFWFRTGKFWGEKAYQLWREKYRIPIISMTFLSYASLVFLFLERKRWREWFLPVAYVIAYHFMILTLYYTDRYRSIVEPFLIIFTAAAIIRILGAARTRWLRTRFGQGV